MTTTESVHIRFARQCDADEALTGLAAHGLTRTPTLCADELEIACSSDEEDTVVNEVVEAIDEWLEERHLPFTPERIDRRTLVVRPPCD